MKLIVVNDYCYFVIVIKAGSRESQADKTKKNNKKNKKTGECLYSVSHV